MQYSDQFLEAIENYLAGRETEIEKQLINDWYHSFDDTVVFAKTNDVKYRKLVEARLLRRIQESTGVEIIPEQTKKISLWPRIAVAASLFLVIGAGFWFFNTNRPLDTSSSRTAGRALLNDVAPGKNGATITLANGQVIELSDAKTGVVIGDRVSYSDGSVVRYSSGTSSSGSLKGSQNNSGPVGVRSLSLSDLQGGEGKGQTLTAQTAKGQTYQFTLPDGTKVWLNAASTLRFPVKFGNGKRNVALSGEGYFEVAKDKAHPFMVNSGGQDVEVLGTHFNINSYADEGTVKTTLLEGSVRVTALNTTTASSAVEGEGSSPRQNEVILKPNQQSVLLGSPAQEVVGLAPQNSRTARLSGSNRLSIKNVDGAKAIAWKDGKFVFNDEPLENIMRNIARWYDVEIEYKGINAKETFGGSISRFENVSKVLEKLELTGGVHFNIEGKKILVTK